MEEDINKSFPLKQIPECWDNDTRMNVLFAPFRKRDVNPLVWDSKMSFWKRCIHMWADDNNCCTFSVSQLQKAFQRKGKTCQCLTTVIEDMLRNGEIILKSDFLEISPSQNQSWTTWTVNNVFKTPVYWAFGKLKNSLISASAIDLDAQYVHLGVFQKNGEKLIDSVKIEQNELLSLDRIKELLQTDSEELIDLTIHWLQLKGAVRVAKHDNITLVKVITNKNKTSEINEVDIAKFSLQQNEHALTKSLEQLELDKQNAEQDARNYLNKGMRQVAKSCLRKKKALDKCIDKRASALENVQVLLTRIQEAESDSKVLDSYKLGLNAMKYTFKEAGLSEDGVSNTINQVQEALDIHDEIQATLAEPVGDNVDADLESELALLLTELPSISGQDDSSDKKFDLPEVPTSEPVLPVSRFDLDKNQKQKIAL